MKKYIVSALIFLTFGAHAFSISLSTSPVNAAVLKAAKDSGAEVTFHNQAEEAMVKLLKNQVDMAVIPLFLAVKLKNQGVDIAVTNVLFADMLFILNNDGTVKKLSDLKGKTVYLGQGTGPLNLFPHMLFKKAGLSDDIKTSGASAVQIAQLTATGKASVSVLREPLVSMVMSKNEYVKKAVNFQTEWEKYFGSRFIQAALVVKSDFARAEPTVMKDFQKKLKDADSWVRSDSSAAASLFASVTGKGNIKITKKAIVSMQPRIEMPDKKEIFSYIALLLGEYKDELGGKMPSDDFVANILN